MHITWKWKSTNFTKKVNIYEKWNFTRIMSFLVRNRFFRFCLSSIYHYKNMQWIWECGIISLDGAATSSHACFHLFPQGTARLHSPRRLQWFFFFSINNRSDNFTGSSFKTNPGFLLREVEVKGYRTIANSNASCLSGILELHREVWVGGGTRLCARPTHFWVW